eukprot:428389_1
MAQQLPVPSAAPIPTTDPLSSLIGSQRDTYQTLIAMGFTTSDSLNVAQIFGSNVEGAIDSLFNATAVNVDTSHDVTSMFAELQDVLATSRTESSPPVFEFKDDSVLKFRTTSLSQRLMSGYVRSVQIHYHIPTVINDLIIRYFNIYFIRLNYNIRNASNAMHIDNNMDMVACADQKQSESAQDSDSEDETTHLEPFTLPVFVIKSDMTLRAIAIEIEKSYKYLYEKMMRDNDYFSRQQYQYFVHLWIPFRVVRTIYPVDNRYMKVSMDRVDQYEEENQCDPNRWVEIPNDFEETKISEMDALFATNSDTRVLELGVERYDQRKDEWPFRNLELVPLPHEIVRKKKKQTEPSGSKTFKQMIVEALNKEENNTKDTQSPSNWNCSFCGEENDKTYVICGSCFKDKPATPAATPPNASPQTTPHIEKDIGPSHTPPPPPRLNISHTPPPPKKIPVSTVAALFAKTPPPAGSKHLQKEDLCDVHEKASPPSVEWTQELKIGDIVDARDEQEKWYESVIRCIESNGEKKKLYLHYIGWNKKWDEPLEAEDVQRIAKRNTYSRGPHRPKRSQYSTRPSTAYPNYREALKIDPNKATSNRRKLHELISTWYPQQADKLMAMFLQNHDEEHVIKYLGRQDRLRQKIDGFVDLLSQVSEENHSDQSDIEIRD